MCNRKPRRRRVALACPHLRFWLSFQAGGARPPAVPWILRFGSGPMLDARFANTSPADGPAQPQSADDALPAIVVRAQEDARCRLALARLGYSKVRAEYAKHKREG